MSNLLKSKFLLGVMTFAIMFVGLVAVSNTAAADCSITSTLRLGSSGAQVVCLQKALGGLTADGSFGPMTKAAVIKFQSNSGLVADGVFGPKSNAVWMANAGNSASFPAGCTSASGYSTTTGQACYAIPSMNSLPAGCTSSLGFSPTTGASCATGVSTTYPAGCTSASGFSPTTGASCSTGAINQQTGPVQVSLSSDNPASGYIIANQATADLAHFTFTGSGTINSVTLQRTGISDQNTLANVYLYSGATRLTDGFSFNNVGQLTMNSLGIAVNGSLTISVRADVANVNNASSLGVTLIGFTAAGQSATTVSVKGNEMTYGSGNLASVYLGNNTVGTSTVNAGTSSYTVWSAPVQVNTRAVWLKGANFRMTGSAPAGSLGNIKLYVDGVATGSAATMGTITGSNYAMFDFSAMPVSLSTGSHTVDVRADIVSGSNYDVTVSIQQAADLVIYDGQVGVNIAPLGVSGTAFTSNTAGKITINPGSASVVTDPTFQSLSNVTGGATNVAIGKFKVHGYGEDVKVMSLSVTPNFAISGTTATAIQYAAGVAAGTTLVTVTSGGTGYIAAPVVTVTNGSCTTAGTATATISGGVVTGITTSGFTCTAGQTFTLSVADPVAAGLNNVTLYFNGSQVGSSQPWTSGALSFNLGSQMILPAGTDSTIEVRADLQTTGSVNYTTGQVSATLNNTPANNAQGQTSHTSITFPSSPVTNNALTVQTGVLSVAQNANYATTQNINPNTTGVKVGSFTLQNQSSSEAVRVTSLVVSLFDSGATNPLSSSTSPALTNFSNLRTSELSGSGSTPVQPSAVNTFSVDFTLAPGATDTIDVLADTSSATSGTIVAKLLVTALGSSSNVTISQNGTGLAVQGQSLTLAAGAITDSGATPSLVASSSTQGQFVPAANGATNATKATFNFASANGTSTITELKFGVSATNSATSVSVNGITAPFVNGTAYLTGLNLVVPNGGSGLNQDVYVSYPVIGTNGLPSYTTTSAVSLSYFKYTSGGITTTITSPQSSVRTAPTMVLVGSKPTLALTGSTDSLGNAQVKVAEVTVTADASGDIKLRALPITISTTGTGLTWDGSAANPSAGTSMMVKDTSGSVIATVTGATAGSGCTTGATAHGVCTSLLTFTGDYLIPAGTSKTFRIYVTAASVSGAVNTMSLSTTLGAASSFSWLDVAGANATPIDSGNATYFYNYPTDTSVIHN